MTRDSTPAQRLAISRARMADALRERTWQVLLQRRLKCTLLTQAFRLFLENEK